MLNPPVLVLGVITGILMIIAPRIVWSLLALRPSIRLLRILPFINSLPERLIRLVTRSKKPLELQLFFERPDSPDSLWSRIGQVLSVDLFVSSLIAPRLVPNGASSTNEFALFFLVGWIAMPFATLPLVLSWTYEDSGLRCFDKAQNTIGPVGSRFMGIFSGASAILGFYQFTVSASNPPISYYSFVGTLLVLSPPCFLATVHFHRKQRQKTIERLRASSLAQAQQIGFKNIGLFDR